MRRNLKELKPMKIVEVDDGNGVNASQFMVDIKEEKIDGGYQQATSGGTFLPNRLYGVKSGRKSHFIR